MPKVDAVFTDQKVYFYKEISGRSVFVNIYRLDGTMFDRIEMQAEEELKVWEPNNKAIDIFIYNIELEGVFASGTPNILLR